MRVVHKYPLETSADVQHVAMPVGARIVHVAAQGGVPTLWAEHVTPPSATFEERMFCLIGTGHPEIENRWEHRGTVFIDWLVVHVYEVPA